MKHTAIKKLTSGLLLLCLCLADAGVFAQPTQNTLAPRPSLSRLSFSLASGTAVRIQLLLTRFHAENWDMLQWRTAWEKAGLQTLRKNKQILGYVPFWRKIEVDMIDVSQAAAWNFLPFPGKTRYLITRDIMECVCVALYAPRKQTGLLVHFTASASLSDLNELLREFQNRYGLTAADMEASVLGGHLPISGPLIIGILEILAKKHVRLKDLDVLQGRYSVRSPLDRYSVSVALDLKTGEVLFAGAARPGVLYQIAEKMEAISKNLWLGSRFGQAGRILADTAAVGAWTLSLIFSLSHNLLTRGQRRRYEQWIKHVRATPPQTMRTGAAEISERYHENITPDIILRDSQLCMPLEHPARPQSLIGVAI